MVIPKVNERLSEEELLAVIGDIDAMLCGDDRVTRKVLENAPKLKVISKWGTGIDSLDQESAKEFGVVIKNTINAFTEPVADSVLGYVLCFARDIINLDREMRQGIWSKRMTKTLGECTLGIVGLGNVGGVGLALHAPRLLQVLRREADAECGEQIFDMSTIEIETI